MVVSGHRVYTDADLEHQYSGKLINANVINIVYIVKYKLNFFLFSFSHHNTTMFAFIILFIMYTGAFWYVDDTVPRKQFTYTKDTSNNATYERTHLF